MMTKTVITLNEYLSNFSLHSRQLDPVIVKWYQRKDQTNMQRSRQEWDSLIKEFLEEK